MSDLALRVENIGKAYRLTRRHSAGHTMLREVLTASLSAPFRRLWRAPHPPASVSASNSIFWALKGISFDVPRGQILGIIGPNGAGKSTLLKILSRITEPTEGRAEISGRVGSLLEVGTGFHPELTGRENIYLNGTLLGMRKGEIDRKFDEIVAFAEIEQFLDTPVKRYSSGMYVRLAFAVAAHFEPEILILDEVLAVGDVSFQRKCLSKMEDVSKHGRTILFVSHSMHAVTRLCERVILIDHGAIQKDGSVVDVISDYLLSSLRIGAERVWNSLAASPGDDVARLREVRVLTQDGALAVAVDISQPVSVEIVFDVLQPGHVMFTSCRFSTQEGVCAFDAHDLDPEWRGRPRPVGRFTSTARVPGHLLAEGTYLIGAGLSTRHPYAVHFFSADAVACRVIDTLDGSGARGDWDGHFPGVVRPLLSWSTTFLPAASGEPSGPPTTRDIGVG
jgi:lipopolysaccharide transport system ATP-binding protein